MARIRTIKPDFWQHPRVTRVSRDARLYFLGLLNEADDEGRLRYSGKRLAGVLFSDDDDVDGRLIDGWTVELENAGLVARYTIDGAPLLLVVGFTEHQKINRPTPSRLPAPLTESSVSPHGDVDEGSLPEGKGREEEEEAEEERSARAHLCPDPFVVDDLLREWGRTTAPLVDLDALALKMADWSRSNAKKKADWRRTIQGWARDNQEKLAAEAAKRPVSADELLW